MFPDSGPPMKVEDEERPHVMDQVYHRNADLDVDDLDDLGRPPHPKQRRLPALLLRFLRVHHCLVPLQWPSGPIASKKYEYHLIGALWLGIGHMHKETQLGSGRVGER